MNIAHSVLPGSEPLKPALERWRRSLTLRGCDDRYIAQQVRNAERVAEALAGRDVNAESIESVMVHFREEYGISPATSNHVLQCFKQFLRFIGAPVPPVQRIREAGRHVRRRRPLESDEISRLLASTASAPTLHKTGLRGRDRCLIYRVAIETGLRAGEIRALTWGRVTFGDEPSIRADAAYTKSKRDDICPISPDLAADLAKLKLANGGSEDDLVFPNFPSRPSDIFKRDLKRAGIPVVRDGRRLDFHALRHTAITDAHAHCSDLALTQAFARHGSVAMTMRYVHVNAGRLVALSRTRRIG